MTRHPRPLRAVLFDWDGTLVDSAEHTYRCYLAVFERFGVVLAPEVQVLGEVEWPEGWDLGED